MFKVSREQMDVVIQTLNNTLDAQREVFHELGFDANDYQYASDEQIDALCAFGKDGFDIEDIRANPLDYLSEASEERQKEIERGATLTDEELNGCLCGIAKNTTTDQFAIIVTVGDDYRKVYGVCIDMMLGQGGNYFVDFLGFFKTSSEAEIGRATTDKYIII